MAPHLPLIIIVEDMIDIKCIWYFIAGMKRSEMDSNTFPKLRSVLWVPLRWLLEWLLDLLFQGYVLYFLHLINLLNEQGAHLEHSYYDWSLIIIWRIHRK